MVLWFYMWSNPCLRGRSLNKGRAIEVKLIHCPMDIINKHAYYMQEENILLPETNKQTKQWNILLSSSETHKIVDHFL